MPLTDEEKNALESAVDNPLLGHVRSLDPIGYRLTGLNNEGVTIDADVSFRSDDDIFISWALRGDHGDGIHAPWEEPGERFLGWAPTGRKVHIRLFTVGKISRNEDGKLQLGRLQTRYDRVQALAQIGVQAFGRPVVSGDGH